MASWIHFLMKNGGILQVAVLMVKNCKTTCFKFEKRLNILGAMVEGSWSNSSSGKPAFFRSVFARPSASRALHSSLSTSKSDESSSVPSRERGARTTVRLVWASNKTVWTHQAFFARCLSFGGLGGTGRLVNPLFGMLRIGRFWILMLTLFGSSITNPKVSTPTICRTPQDIRVFEWAKISSLLFPVQLALERCWARSPYLDREIQSIKWEGAKNTIIKSSTSKSLEDGYLYRSYDWNHDWPNCKKQDTAGWLSQPFLPSTKWYLHIGHACTGQWERLSIVRGMLFKIPVPKTINKYKMASWASEGFP